MIFITYPEIDIEFSKLFFSESKRKFYFANNLFLSNKVFFFKLGVYPSKTKTGLIPKNKSLHILLKKPSKIPNSFDFAPSVDSLT